MLPVHKSCTKASSFNSGVLAVLWVVQDEVIHSSIQVGNAVPPIPALAALLLLAAAARIALRRRGRGARSEAPSSQAARILFIYILITVAAASLVENAGAL